MYSFYYEIKNDIFQIFSNSKFLLNILEERKQDKNITSDAIIKNIGFLEQFNFSTEEDFLNNEIAALFKSHKGNKLYISINIHNNNDILNIKQFAYNIIAGYYKERSFFIEGTAVSMGNRGILIIGEKLKRNILALKYIVQNSARLIEADVILCCFGDSNIEMNGIFNNIIIRKNDFMEARRGFHSDDESLQYEIEEKEVLLKKDFCMRQDFIKKIVFINPLGDFNEHFIEARYGRQKILDNLIYREYINYCDIINSDLWKNIEYSYINI